MPNYLCVINEAGPANYGATSNPNVYVNLTDTGGSFANTWFYAADGIQDQILDVGIAAIVRGELVDVTADAPNAGGSPYTELTRMLRSRPVAPAAPSGLHVSQPMSAVSEGRSIITFAWTDNSGGEAAFRLIYIGQLAGYPSDLQEVSDLKATTFAFNVLNGYEYSAQVSAYTVAGESPFESITGPIPGQPPVPAAPAGLQVKVSAKDANDTLIDLSWTGSFNNETGFVISFTAIAGIGVTLAPITVPANTVTYSFSVVNNGTTYSATVQAYNPSGKSPATDAATFTVPPANVAPPAFITAGVNLVLLTGGAMEWDLDISGSYFQNGEKVQLVIAWWADNDGDPGVYTEETLANVLGGFTYAFPGVNDPSSDPSQRFQIQATGQTSGKTVTISI